MREYGVTIDDTSGKWADFAKKMKLANGIKDDFASLNSSLTSIAKILGKLNFGDVISEEDFGWFWRQATRAEMNVIPYKVTYGEAYFELPGQDRCRIPAKRRFPRQWPGRCRSVPYPGNTFPEHRQ